MHLPASPAARRPICIDPSIPWDVIEFQRTMPDGSCVAVTINRAKLARLIARRAATNACKSASSYLGAITAVIVPDAK